MCDTRAFGPSSMGPTRAFVAGGLVAFLALGPGCSPDRHRRMPTVWPDFQSVVVDQDVRELCALPDGSLYFVLWRAHPRTLETAIWTVRRDSYPATQVWLPDPQVWRSIRDLCDYELVARGEQVRVWCRGDFAGDYRVAADGLLTAPNGASLKEADLAARLGCSPADVTLGVWQPRYGWLGVPASGTFAGSNVRHLRCVRGTRTLVFSLNPWIPSIPARMIRQLDPQTRRGRPLLTVPRTRRVLNPQPSPDGEFLLYEEYRTDPRSQISVVLENVRSHRRRYLHGRMAEVRPWPAGHPDTFVIMDAGKTGMLVVSTQGSILAQVPLQRPLCSLSLSPSGREVALVWLERPPTAVSRRVLGIYDLSARRLMRVAENVVDEGPRWQPDAGPNQLLFCYAGQLRGSQGIALAARHAGRWVVRKLTDAAAHDGQPTWLRDGSEIAFVRDRREVWTSDLAAVPRPKRVFEIPATEAERQPAPQ
jgi:hypothetical protein